MRRSCGGTQPPFRFHSWWNAPHYPSDGVAAFAENLISLAQSPRPSAGSPESIAAYNVAYF
jgi:hypothetical protein